MNIKSTIMAAGVLSLLSFGASAATQVNAQQAENLEPITVVSVSGISSSPMDMRQMLNQKAEQNGASSYRIIEAYDGDHRHVTAELYK